MELRWKTNKSEVYLGLRGTKWRIDGDGYITRNSQIILFTYYWYHSCDMQYIWGKQEINTEHQIFAGKSQRNNMGYLT
jgi:hypothetical protein